MSGEKQSFKSKGNGDRLSPQELGSQIEPLDLLVYKMSPDSIPSEEVIENVRRLLPSVTRIQVPHKQGMAVVVATNPNSSKMEGLIFYGYASSSMKMNRKTNTPDIPEHLRFKIMHSQAVKTFREFSRGGHNIGILESSSELEKNNLSVLLITDDMKQSVEGVYRANSDEPSSSKTLVRTNRKGQRIVASVGFKDQGVRNQFKELIEDYPLVGMNALFSLLTPELVDYYQFSNHRYYPGYFNLQERLTPKALINTLRHLLGTRQMDDYRNVGDIQIE